MPASRSNAEILLKQVTVASNGKTIKFYRLADGRGWIHDDHQLRTIESMVREVSHDITKNIAVRVINPSSTPPFTHTGVHIFGASVFLAWGFVCICLSKNVFVFLFLCNNAERTPSESQACPL